MISIEKVSRILNHFNIAFTEQAVLGHIQRGQLDRAPRIEIGYQSRNTRYGYSVDKDSLVKFLLARGATEEDIIEVLPA
ncbi:MAG: hypothetical protein RR595_03950 [Lysinibacillus sp.]